MRTYVILHNIRSAHNVGSIFRTADGASVSKIFLTGYTPAPIDRFGRERKEIAKTSLGASKTLPYESVRDAVALITRLKSDGVVVVAVEQTPIATHYKEFHNAMPSEMDVAFVFGNEITGIEHEVLNACSHHIHIPMHGTKESLNVSVCAGIILFQSTPKSDIRCPTLGL